MKLYNQLLKELVSVIIPVYNAENFLEKCLDSVCIQTYDNLEIILVNDGSTDHSGQICNEYARKDKRIKVINKKNTGISDTRNVGINISRGNWLVFVDSDDVLRENAIEVLYQTAKAKGVKMVVGDYQEFDIDAKFENDRNYNVEMLSVEDALEELIIKQPERWVTMWAKIFDQNLFEGIRFPLGRIYEDTYVMHLLLEKAGCIAKLDYKVYCYRQLSNSIMGTYGMNKIDDLYTAYLLRTDFLRKHNYLTLYQQQKDLLEWNLHHRYMESDKIMQKELCEVYRKYYRKNFWSFTWKYRIVGFANCILHKM